MPERSISIQNLSHWPETFPRMKNHYRRIEPVVNEPIILRYNSKALFKTECENLTYGSYRQLGEKSKKKGSFTSRPNRHTQLPPVAKSSVVGTPEGSSNASAIDERKRLIIEEGRNRLFQKFPEVRSVFARRKQPLNYLKLSQEMSG
jgi:hypothetical protein